MTDPVDTDALRDMGAALTSDGHTFGRHIIAAADEVDRLRAENEHLAGELSAVAANRDHTADEFRRLRSVIENAPHAIGCSWFNTAAGLSCNCWKGDEP